MTTLYTFLAAVTLPEKGLEGGSPHPLPHISIPHSLKLLYGLVKAHPQYVVAFLLIAAIGIIVGIAIGVARGRVKRLRRLALFKPVSRLAPTDLGIENYLGQGCYIRRESDDTLAGFFEEGVSAILVVGKTGSGKTRTVFEALKGGRATPAGHVEGHGRVLPDKGKEDYYILAPRPRLTSLRELSVPGLSRKRIVLFLDDLPRYIKKLDVGGLLRQMEGKAKGLVLLATCSPDKLPLLEREAPEFLRLFRPKNHISLRDLTPAEQKSLASALGRDETTTLANATPASLALNLAEMKERYKNSGDARLIIHSLLLLHRTFISTCRESLVREVCGGVFNKTFSRSQWRGALKGLIASGLIARGSTPNKASKGGTLEIYEGYLGEDFVDDYTPREEDMDALQEVLLKSRDWEGLFSIGVYRSTKGQWEKALQVLERAVEVNPHSGEIRYLLGEAHQRTGMIERALEDYKEVVRLDKRNPKALYALGTIYNEMYMIKEAVEVLRRVVLLDPNHSGACFQLAMAFEKAGMIEECLAMLREATSIDPNYTEAHRYLAGLYQKRGQYGEALQEYRELARINPNDEEVHLVLATAYNKLGRVNEAMMELRELIRINPSNLKAHYTLALTYYKKGMLEEAIKEFKDVLILSPEDHSARSNLALAYSKKNLLDEAIEEYKEILRLRPQEVGACYNLAQTYEKKGYREEAVARYKEVIGLNPEHAEAHYRLALINLKGELLEEAMHEFREVIRLRPTHAMAHGQLAMIYQKLGLMAEARREYRLYTQLKAR
ncbi:MAG: tetratricopeptide repeat protein [Candidatus Brocadiaceae bacterium]|nr:tetratricopeptide repeat protein [Candidatus Brocadiaceae bacterium]